jgi:ankyrin repeat protein
MTDENEPQVGHTPPLHEAVRGENRRAVIDCLKAGEDVNGLDGRGDTALHWAAFRGKRAIVSTLLSNGARVDIQNENGMDPGDVARKNGYPKIVTLLENRKDKIGDA